MKISKRTDWYQMEEEVMALIKRLRKKPKENKMSHYLEPGSILNCYREGDLTFKGAVRELHKWKNKEIEKASAKRKR